MPSPHFPQLSPARPACPGDPPATVRSVIDLHTHSRCSDGTEPPERVVELAAAAGCSAVALTDHDTLAGLPAAAAAAERLGIRLVGGCEVSCATDAPSGSAHVLCYFLDGTGSPLEDELARLRADRAERNAALFARLAELGLPATEDEVRAEAGGSDGIGRPHVAAVLVRNGAARSVDDAFARFLAKGAPAYVGKARVTVEHVARLALASGAVATLAHPGSLGLADGQLDATVARFAAAGLAGLECHYGRYDPARRAHLAALAARHRLVATGGSDFHGGYKADLAVGTGTGDLSVPDAALAELEGRRRS